MSLETRDLCQIKQREGLNGKPLPLEEGEKSLL